MSTATGRLVVDVDALVKLAHWGLLDALETATGIPAARQATVESIRFRAARGDAKLFRDPAVAGQLAAALAGFGAAWAPDGEVVARLQGVPGLDAGEIALVGMLCSDPSALLVTGDKRALKALAVPALADIAQRIAGRVLCLEQVLLGELEMRGALALASAIEPYRELDTAVRCAVPLPAHATDVAIREGLGSYIGELNREAPRLLGILARAPITGPP